MTIVRLAQARLTLPAVASRGLSEWLGLAYQLLVCRVASTSLTKERVNTTSIALLLVLLGHAPYALATDAYDACKTNMDKLALEFDLQTLQERVDRSNRAKNSPKGTGPSASFALPVRRAERITANAYGMTKQQLDAVWPKFFQFSVLTLVDNVRDFPRLEALSERLFLACVREFG